MKKRFLLAAPVAASLVFSTVPALSAQELGLSPIVINEVESNGDEVGDWVELANTSAEPVDVSGWWIVDNGAGREPLHFPAGSIVPAGGYLSIYTDTAGGFGLGGEDSVTLFDAAGTQVDFTEWSGHAATSWGRVPDMTGDFAATKGPTKDATNTAAMAASNTVVINEVESNGDAFGDWIELANTDTNNSVDISGWQIVDDQESRAPIVLPQGTEIESGGYFLIYTDATTLTPGTGVYAGIDHFGLGKDDTVTIKDAAGEVIASWSWAAFGEHAATTYGRVPDMTGEFATTGAPTPGAANIAGDGNEGGQENPAAPNATLPFHNADVSVIELGGAFSSGDMSGADFDDKGRAWVVNNGSGALYALDLDVASNTYTLASQWQTTYPAGTGTLDAEGVAVADNGDLYFATERNNDEKTVSRPSILRFAAPTDGSGALVAEQEWNLSEFTGVIEANGGLEAIVQLEGTIFAVGVEETGDVIVVDLAGDKPQLVQKYESAFPGVMALDYNSDSMQLHVVCDEACAGASQFLEWNGSELVAADNNIYERPANLGNYANEGFASYTSELECTDGSTVSATNYLWADDSAKDNFNALHGAQVIDGDCEINGGDDTDNGENPGDDSTKGSSNGTTSSTFAAGSFAGSLATTLLGAFGIASVLGGLYQQLLATFPTLKPFIRF